MTSPTFNREMTRLKTQWPNSYGTERMALIWNAFQRVRDDVFSAAVSDLIATHRTAPLIPDIERAVNMAQTRRLEERTVQNFGFGDAIYQAQKKNQTADPEFVKTGVELWKKYVNGKVSRGQFFQGCDLLDEASGLLAPKASVHRMSGRDKSAGEDA